MQTKLRTYTNKGMQIVTRAERKLRYKQNMTDWTDTAVY